MMPHEGAINASRRKNWCVATEIIVRRDAKNNASRWKKTAIFHPIVMHSTELSHEAPHALKGRAASGVCGPSARCLNGHEKV